MTGYGQFQLFPPPPPKNKSANNPFRRPCKETSRTRSPSPVPLEELKSSANTESVLIQIIEDTKVIHPPQAHIGQSRSPTAMPEPSHTSKPGNNHRSPARNGERTGSSLSHASQSTNSPLRSNMQQKARSQQSPASPKSPVVAMRSIFPRYNHELPLDKQEYYPRNAGSSSLPPADVDAILGPKTVPASVVNFPTDVLSSQEVQYSSAEELLSLWECANGQQLQGSLGTFNLRMERIDAATFTFGDPQLPLYTVQTYSTDELSIMRTHPLKPNRSVQVMMLKLEDRARRQPPHDGLVTVIFSKLAAMLAVEQAAELRRLHHLAPTEALEVETNAIKRAAAQESCRLIWNARQGRYELQHPALLKQHAPSLVGEDGNPLSRVQTKKPGTLHITVSKRTATEAGNPPPPPAILVTSPVPPNAVEGADSAATPRTSTLPLTDNDEPLASLDLGSMCLSICAGLTTSIIPSLYAIDSLIAAILAVAISDEATNPILADMQIYISGRETSRASVRRSRIRNSVAAVQTKRLFTGKLVATLAEREDAEEEAKLMEQLRSSSGKTSKENERRKSGTFLSRSGGKSKSKSKSKKIVIDEIDLEKYGRYGSGSSREGQQLPGPIRLVLRLMVWALEVVVTVLSAGVKCLAWLLVNVTRCVTSERF
ncbi:hypothetical protein VTN77DRAFT_8167 [Rasamsonia byssochlamydoides]|uniref:uncharacterized protein n=1 Tax=Rasamsonia byssochlamydoides TaxID=89139 RepID=UPI003742FD6C